MSWIILTLLANTFFSLTNIFDKFFNSKKIKSVYTFAFLLNLVYFFFVLVVSLFMWKTFVLNWSVLYATIAGVFWFLMWICFWKAMQTGEASRVTAIFFAQPIFSAIIAVIFFEEKLNGLKWLAILMIVIGAFLSSWEGKSKKFTFNKAYLFAIAAAVLSASGNAVSKFAMNGLPSLTVNSVAFFATIPLYLLLLKNKKVFKEVKDNLKDKKIMGQFFMRGLIGYLGIFSWMLALGLGPLALTSALSGTQPIFVLIFSVICSILLPKYIHEEISKKSLIEKSLAIILIVTGAMLISF